MSRPKQQTEQPPSTDTTVREISGAEANRAVTEIVDRALTVPQQGTPIARCPTNIDTRTPEGKAMLVKALSPGEYDFGPERTIRILATRFVMFPDVQTDEQTGELHEFVRVAFFDANGKHYRTTAAHAPFKLFAMLELYTPREWDDGVPIVIKERKSKRGRVYHDINIDLEIRYGL